jgi:hypothetical protein
LILRALARLFLNQTCNRMKLNIAMFSGHTVTFWAMINLMPAQKSSWKTVILWCYNGLPLLS